MADAKDFAPVHGDNQPFDPTHLLVYKRLILFGANYYADKLPITPSWLVWDKLNGLSGKRTVGFNDNADCELAWTSLDGPARIFRHRWMGTMKETEIGERRIHPTQKPVRLLRRIIEWRAPSPSHIFDPYAGSGSTIIAALEEGCTVTAVEIVSDYCASIVERIQAYYAGTREGDTPSMPKMVRP
jgi:site-specific DNA-methyltransferase (adenine-specific)/modification methylase